MAALSEAAPGADKERKTQKKNICSTPILCLLLGF